MTSKKPPRRKNSAAAQKNSLSDCCEVTSVSKIKVEALGKKAVFVNAEREEYVRTTFDGCVVAQQTAADFVVSKAGVGDVIVELKGGGIEHAVKQIFATAEYLRLNKMISGRLGGLVVGTRYPRFDSTVQNTRSQFARRFCGALHVVTTNYEYKFEHVLSFRGPHTD